MSERPSTDVPPKKCLGCGYMPAYLPENRCPECSRVFWPDNTDTFHGGDPRRRRMTDRGRSRWTTLVVVIAVIVSIIFVLGAMMVFLLIGYFYGFDGLFP